MKKGSPQHKQDTELGEERAQTEPPGIVAVDITRILWSPLVVETNGQPTKTALTDQQRQTESSMS